MRRAGRYARGGSGDAEEVDDEDQRLAGETVAATRRAVGELRRDDELAATADLHSRDTVLPALDQTAERELDGLAPVPGRIELLAAAEFDAQVVHPDLRARHRLCSVANG